MRTIPPALQEKLDSGVTTLCRCWILTRSDGVVLGFTDHDRDLVVDGVLCRADTGAAGSEATQATGMAIGGSELFGALSAQSLAEDDLAAGLYDAAAARMFIVDWSEPELKVLVSAGVVGDVRRRGAAFTAELRGPAHRLAEASGRLYTPACGADLGDARCRVDLSASSFRGEGSVASVIGAAAFIAAGLDGFDDGWFTGGRLTFASGDNAGFAVEVKEHRAGAEGMRLALWQAPPQGLGDGDTFAVTAGCDKRFATCRDRFDNGLNFRGFPHIPGNDFIIRYPLPGEPGHDGRSLAG